jgi:hypothetical protein
VRELGTAGDERRHADYRADDHDRGLDGHDRPRATSRVS